MARKLRGNTTIEMIKSKEEERPSFKPIGTSITTTPTIGQSYNKMMGGTEKIGPSGGYGLMSNLEAASMRLADAASKRSIAEKEAETNLEAQRSGFRNIREMQMNIDRKRKEQERQMQESRPYTIDRRGRRVYQ